MRATSTPVQAAPATPARAATTATPIGLHPAIPTATRPAATPAPARPTPPPPTATALSRVAPPTQAVPTATPRAATPSTANKDGMTLSISPAAAPVGATVRVSGQGLNPRGRVSPDVYVNLSTPSGAVAMQAAAASAVRLAADGSLTASFVVPKTAGGQQSICIAGQVGPSGQGSICAPFTVLGGDAAPAADSATPRGNTGSTQCYSCQVISNDAARRWGVYNSGSGKYEYHGAQPQH